MTRTAALILAASFAAFPARAAVWYVAGNAGGVAGDGTSWSSAFQTIQQGVNAARTGDEVWVAATTSYVEAVRLDRPGVALYGGFRGTEVARQERIPTLRSGSLPFSNAGPSFWVHETAAGAVLDGFDVSGVSGGAAVRTDADSVTLRNNAIHNNNAGFQIGGGVYSTGNRVVIADNIITDNIAAAGGGMYVRSDNGRIERNQIRNNTADNLGRNTAYTGIGGGLYLLGTGLQVRNNVIARNTAIRYFATPAGPFAEGGGIYAEGDITFVNNTLAYNSTIGTDGARGGGFSLANGTFTLANNMSFRNSARAVSEGAPASGGGIYLPAAAPRTNAVFRANYFYDDAPDAGVPDGTDTLFGYFPQFVSESDFHPTKGSPLIDIGANEYLALEDHDADGGPRVIGRTVDIGSYEFGTSTMAPTLSRGYVRPDGDDRNGGASWTTARRSVGSILSVMKPGGEVWVAGGTYAERISLKAGLALYGGFVGTEEAVAARAPDAPPSVLDGRGRGTVVMIPSDAIGAVIDGFTIRHGSGTGQWGSPTVGGGILSDARNAVISNNIVEDNHVYGGGSENWPVGSGGGAYVVGSGSLIVGNVFRDNRVETGGRATAYAAFASSSGGGLTVSSDFAVVLNNLFTGNSASAGGPMIAGGASDAGLLASLAGGVIAGNTIAHNAASPGYGGTFPAEEPLYASPHVANNIIAFDAGSRLTGYGLPYFTNNLVYGNTWSYPATAIGRNGNISADPLFANAVGGDYRLSPLSPAIDAGDNNAAFSAVDMDGNPRFHGVAVDIGAYEWTPGGPLTMADAAAALRIAAGLSAATPDAMQRLKPDTALATGIDIRDAVTLLREVVR